MELSIDIDFDELLKIIVEQSSKRDIHLLFNHLLMHCQEVHGNEAVEEESKYIRLLENRSVAPTG